MSKSKTVKQTVCAAPRKLKGSWTIEPTVDYEVTDLAELDLWLMVRDARRDYYKLVRDVVEVTITEQDFAYYMEQNWGIKVHVGPRLGDHEVVNEKKYTLFLLKYAGKS